MTATSHAIEILTVGADAAGQGLVELSLTEAARSLWAWVKARARPEDRGLIEAADKGEAVSVAALREILESLCSMHPDEFASVVGHVNIDSSRHVGNADRRSTLIVGGDIVGGDKA